MKAEAMSDRRSDAAAAGRQLADALKLRFGPDRVFFDTANLALATPWYPTLVEQVRSADAVIAVIGRHWLSAADERGKRLVLSADEEDVLRTEIETALRAGRLVVPVLVDDAVLPPR